MKKLALILLVFVFAGCDQAANSAGEVNIGGFAGREYRNDYFGFTLPVPEPWRIEDMEAVQEMMAKEAEFRTVLFSISNGFTAIYCFAADLKAQSIRDPSDYFRLVMKEMDQKAVPDATSVRFGEIRTAKFDDIEFQAMSVTTEFGTTAIHQYLYATEIKGHILAFSIVYPTSNDFATGQRVLQSIQFVK